MLSYPFPGDLGEEVAGVLTASVPYRSVQLSSGTEVGAADVQVKAPVYHRPSVLGLVGGGGNAAVLGIACCSGGRVCPIVHHTLIVSIVTVEPAVRREVGRALLTQMPLSTRPHTWVGTAGSHRHRRRRQLGCHRVR